MARLADYTATLEQKTGAAEFNCAALIYMREGATTAAAYRAELMPAPKNVVSLFKSAIGAGTLSNQSEITEFRSLVEAFLTTLRGIAVFDTMAGGGMFRLPLRTRVSAIASTIDASEVVEAAAKPIKRMSFSDLSLQPTKAVGLVVASKELLEAAGTVAVGLIGRELRGTVIQSTDTVFLAGIAATNAGPGNSGDTFETLISDLAALMHAIDVGADSRLYLIVRQEQAKAMTRHAFSHGITTMTPQGGTFMGLNVLVSDAQANDTVTIADATGIGYGDTELELATSEHAALQMDDAPTQSSATPTATQIVSMWQTNSKALRVERSFAFKVVRPRSVASLTNVAWGSTESPAA